MANKPRRIGIVGFGQLGKIGLLSFYTIYTINIINLLQTGQYLAQEVLKNAEFELAFVWNRSSQPVLDKLDQKFILLDLQDFPSRYQRFINYLNHCAYPHLCLLFQKCRSYSRGITSNDNGEVWTYVFTTC